MAYYEPAYSSPPEYAAEGEEYKACDGSGSIELPAAFSQKNKQGIVLKAGQRDYEGEEL